MSHESWCKQQIINGLPYHTASCETSGQNAIYAVQYAMHQDTQMNIGLVSRELDYRLYAQVVGQFIASARKAHIESHIEAHS